jgi:hypothetical protein
MYKYSSEDVEIESQRMMSLEELKSELALKKKVSTSMIVVKGRQEGKPINLKS